MRPSGEIPPGRQNVIFLSESLGNGDGSGYTCPFAYEPAYRTECGTG